MKNKEEKLKTAVLLAAQRDGQELMDADNAGPCEPASQEARARLFAAIEKKKKPSKERHWYTPTAKKVTIAVASVVIFLVMIPSTTEAGRKWITSLIGKVFPTHTEYSLTDYEKVPNSEAKRYTLGYVPEGYHLDSEKSSATSFNALYWAANDHFIVLDVMGPTGVAHIDTENAERIDTVHIGDEAGTLIVCDGITTIVWSYDELVFMLGANDLEEAEILQIANSIHEY